MDVVTTFERVLDTTSQVIDRVEPDQLGNPTPCAEWDVRAVINHITGGATMFAECVEQGYLLVPVGHEPHFGRRRTAGVFHEPVRRESTFTKRVAQRRRRAVATDEAHEVRASAEGHDVMCDVGGATDAILLAAKLHDGDRRFR